MAASTGPGEGPSPRIAALRSGAVDLIDAVQNDKPYNEVERGVKTSLVTSMGRMACHTGRIVTFDEMLNCEHEFAPTVDKLTFDGPAPVLADANGKYPVPAPGIKTTREY